MNGYKGSLHLQRTWLCVSNKMRSSSDWRRALEMDLWHAAMVVLGEATGRIIDGGLEKRYIGAPTQKWCGMTVRQRGVFNTKAAE